MWYQSILGLVDVIRWRRGIACDCCRRCSQTWRTSFSWSGEVHHGKPSTDEEGSAPQTQQLDRLWNAAEEWGRNRKPLSWGSNGRLRMSGVSRSKLTQVIRPILSWRIPDKPPRWKVVVESRHQDSWPPEEKNSMRGQRRGLIAQSFCVIKFY